MSLSHYNTVSQSFFCSFTLHFTIFHDGKLLCCAGCAISSLSGRPVHIFRKSSGASSHAWVRVVQVKKWNSTAVSVTENVCGAHSRPEDYVPGNMTEFTMGC